MSNTEGTPPDPIAHLIAEGLNPPPPEPQPGEDPDDAVYRQSLMPEDGKAQEPPPVNGDGAATTGNQQTTTPQSTPEPAGQPAPSPQPDMIPKIRFDQVLGKLDSAIAERDYFKGQADAYSAMAKQGGPGQPPEPSQPELTPEEKLTQLASDRVALAEKYDSGELSMTQFVEKTNEIDGIRRGIEQEMFQPQAATPDPQAQPQPQPSATSPNPGAAPQPQPDSAYVLAETRRIEDQYPAVLQLSDDHLNRLITDTTNFLKQNGANLDGEAGDLFLREEIAKRAAGAAEHYAALDSMFSVQQPPQPTAQPQAPQQPQQQPPAGYRYAAPQTPLQGPSAQDRRNKLELHASMPPTIDDMPSKGSYNGEPTAEEIARMPEDELDALPASVRRKYLEGPSTL